MKKEKKKMMMNDREREIRMVINVRERQKNITKKKYRQEKQK